MKVINRVAIEECLITKHLQLHHILSDLGTPIKQPKGFWLIDLDPSTVGSELERQDLAGEGRGAR